MSKFISVISVIAGFILLIVIISLLASIPTMLLWNWLMPDIFGLKTINFIQAFGINLLSSILFKSSNNNKNKD